MPQHTPNSRSLPLAVICGRPNVGKSTLFNRITGKQRAIVHPDEGITRDRTYGTAEWNGVPFRVVDTGGMVEQPVDPVTHKMQEHVRAAMREASVIVFVLDGQQEITRPDETIRNELFKLGKPVLVAVNKLDNAALTLHRAEFYALGLGEPYAISATHNTGIAPLLDALVEHLPKPEADAAEPLGEEPKTPVTKVAVIGKPNVGKSSFVNAILNEERTIVTDIPGTTRDAIDVEFSWNGQEYLLIDTAGMRRKAQIRQDVERYSVNRALRSVNRADVCLMLMDAVEGMSEQDKRILNYVTERGTGIVLVWTKWDLVEDKEAAFKRLDEELDRQAPFIKFVPSITVSNITRQRVFKTLEYIDRVAGEARKRIGTGEFNRFLETVKAHTPAAMRKGRQAKILYGTQAGIKPTTFVLFVNQKQLFHFSYLRFIENRIREQYSFEGVPIKIELRVGDAQQRTREQKAQS